MNLIPRHYFIELGAAWTATSFAVRGAQPRSHAPLPDVVAPTTQILGVWFANNRITAAQ